MQSVRIHSATLILLLLSACPVLAADRGTRGLAMADAMLNMMNGIGLLGQSSRQLPQTPMDGWQWNSSPGRFMGNRVPGTPSPGSSMGGMPAPGHPLTWMGYQPGSPPNRLDGIWQGRAGEHLFIKGNRFRLQADDNRRADGMLQLRERHLLLQTQEAPRPMLFEYAEQKGRLVLRTPDGNLYLYRRMDVGENTRSHGRPSR